MRVQFEVNKMMMLGLSSTDVQIFTYLLLPILLHYYLYSLLMMFSKVLQTNSATY